MKLRQITVISQDVLSEGGRELATPCRRVAACGVCITLLPDAFRSTISPSLSIFRSKPATFLPRGRSKRSARLSLAATARRLLSALLAISNTAPA
jgi:hypothetical protein